MSGTAIACNVVDWRAVRRDLYRHLGIIASKVTGGDRNRAARCRSNDWLTGIRSSWALLLAGPPHHSCARSGCHAPAGGSCPCEHAAPANCASTLPLLLTDVLLAYGRNFDHSSNRVSRVLLHD